jgi:hypothetical protein
LSAAASSLIRSVPPGVSAFNICPYLPLTNRTARLSTKRATKTINMTQAIQIAVPAMPEYPKYKAARAIKKNRIAAPSMGILLGCL